MYVCKNCNRVFDILTADGICRRCNQKLKNRRRYEEMNRRLPKISGMLSGV